MDDTHPQFHEPAFSPLGESLAQVGECHRALAQEIAGFARDESLRFANLRLERTGETLDKLQHCHGLPGLIGVQQEWLRDLMQDYANQNLRVAGALRGLAQNAMASATEAASENIASAQQQAGDVVQHAAEEVSRQDADGYAQEPLH